MGTGASAPTGLSSGLRISCCRHKCGTPSWDWFPNSILPQLQVWAWALPECLHRHPHSRVKLWTNLVMDLNLRSALVPHNALVRARRRKKKKSVNLLIHVKYKSI